MTTACHVTSLERTMTRKQLSTWMQFGLAARPLASFTHTTERSQFNAMAEICVVHLLFIGHQDNITVTNPQLRLGQIPFRDK
jgi:hypothetical protein